MPNKLHEHLNQQNSVKSNIRSRSSENSIILDGIDDKDGTYSEYSFLFDDPDLKTKVNNKIDAMGAYQRAELEKFLNEALTNFDNKLADLKAKTNNFIDNL